MPVLSSELVKRKKEHVFAEGNEIDVATELTGGTSSTEEVIHIFGQDDPLVDINVDNSTLTITVYDKESNNKLFDALQRIDSATATTYQYKWDNVYETTVWANRFNRANSEYTRSSFYKNWLPSPGMTAGDAAAKGTRSFTGNAAIPREYNYPILGEKLLLTTGASGTSWSATLSKATPQAVPNVPTTPGTTQEIMYAIRVMALQEERSPTDNTLTAFALEELTITKDMVDSAGAITINGSNTSGDLDKLPWATHVYVNYLYENTIGVYPTVKPNGMFEQIT